MWTFLKRGNASIVLRYSHAILVRTRTLAYNIQKNRRQAFAHVPPTLGFKRTTWNFFPTSHGKGAPDGIGGTVKRTADNLIVRWNDIVNGNVFHEMVGKSLCSTKLYIITEADMHPYDALLSQSLKPVPATRKLHQVTPTYRNDSEIHCRSLSCFCSEPQMCKCFSPTIFQLTANTPGVQVEDDGPIPMQKRKGRLAMLMEEMEQEQSEQEPMEQEQLTKTGPDGTVTDLSDDVVHCGDWFAVIYDHNWWLAKAVTVDAVELEFFHPHGPNTRFYPKGGGKGYVLHTI
ncbi:unnamed protein product [Menidia menidia]|uniref:(Atlantic silverside) hypothetical protein n=1 Tax=Menidia menidia TaxID=238744 RepID=A0A8S4BU73_9TELE|nr:unnamed protein product [Menidia menidia]